MIFHPAGLHDDVQKLQPLFPLIAFLTVVAGPRGTPASKTTDDDSMQSAADKAGNQSES